MFIELNDNNVVVLTAAEKFNEKMIEVPEQDDPLGKIFIPETMEFIDNYFDAQNKKIKEINALYDSESYKKFDCLVKNNSFAIQNISKTRDALAEQIARIKLEVEILGENATKTWVFQENGLSINLTFDELKQYWLLLVKSVNHLFDKKESIIKEVLIIKNIESINSFDYISGLMLAKQQVIDNSNGIFV